MALLGDPEPGGASPITSHALAGKLLPSEPCPGRSSAPSSGGQESFPGPPAPGCLSGVPARPPSASDGARAEQSSTRSAVTVSAWTFILRVWLCSGSSCPDKAVGGRSRGRSCLSSLPLDPAEVIFIVQGPTPGAQPFSPAPAVSHLPACEQTRLLAWAPVPLPCVPKRPSTLLPRPPRPRWVMGTCVPAHGCVASPTCGHGVF